MIHTPDLIQNIIGNLTRQRDEAQAKVAEYEKMMAEGVYFTKDEFYFLMAERNRNTQ